MRKLTLSLALPLLLLLVVELALLSPVAKAQDGSGANPDAHAGWSAPTVVYPAEWPTPLRFSMDDAATRLAAMIPSSGASEHERNIVVSERTAAGWQTPVIVAQNGVHSDAPFQVLPQKTQPILSGDGDTLVYVGWTGSTYGPFGIERLPGGGWSAPGAIATGLANVHYLISISQDGDTLALADYPFLGTQQLYVLRRQGGGWGAPLLIGPGGNPSLDATGEKLAYVHNGHVYFSELIGGDWSDPQAVTDNDPNQLWVEYPQMSGDGRSIYYWLVTLEQQGMALVRTGQDLYVLRRTGSGWGAPQKVNAAPVLPSHVTEGPAAADQYATRFVYTRPVTATEPSTGESYIYSSQLDISEGITTTWQSERLVAASGYGDYSTWPQLAPDGKTLLFAGGSFPVNGALVQADVWEVTTGTAAPVPPWSFSVTAQIGPSGGSLYSPIDNITYQFGAGVFTGTVAITHVPLPPPLPRPPPPGLAPPGPPPIGGIGGGLGSLFSTTLLGPGGLPIQPALPVTITVDHRGFDLGPTIPGTLGLWRLDGDQWTPLPGVDEAGGVLTATVDHFSTFAVLGETKPLYLPHVAR